MKKFICALVLFTISIVYSQPTLASDSPKKDSTELVAQQEVNPTVDYVFSKLEVYAKSLKVPVEKMYSVLIKQQLVNSIINLIIFLIGIALLFIFIYMVRNLNVDEHSIGIPAAVIMVTSGITILYGIFSIGSITTGFVNPEYGAIKEILNVLK